MTKQRRALKSKSKEGTRRILIAKVNLSRHLTISMFKMTTLPTKTNPKRNYLRLP